MASIPLPALALQPPQQQPSPIEQYGKLMALRTAAGNQQLQQQEIQSSQTENQLKQMQLQDQMKLRQSAQNLDWSQPDAFDKFLQGAQKGGVSPQTLSALAMQRQQYLKSVADTDEATNKATVSRNNILLGHLDAVKGVTDPAARAQIAAQQAGQILQQGLVKDPQTIQQMQAVASGQHVPTDDEIKIMESGLLDHNTQIEQTLKGAQTAEAGADTARATAQAGEATANTNKIVQETQYGPTGPAAEGRYRYVLSRLQQHLPVSDQDMAAAKAFEASNAKSTTQSDSLGVTSTNTSRPSGLAMVGRGPSGGQAATPAAGANPPAANGAPPARSNADALTDMIGQYKVNPAQMARLTAKHPEILAAVQQKYPDWDQTSYNAKNKLIEGYTSGSQSKEINAINTAMGHLSDLDGAVAALNNGDVTALNKLGNKIGVNLTGQTAAAAFQTILHRVGPEVTSAYIPGAGGEGERVANEKDFDTSLPPQTLHNNIATSVNLLRSKIGALESQYKNTVGRDDFQQRFITPSAQQSIQRFSGQGSSQNGKTVGTIFARDPQGVLHKAAAGTALPAGWKQENQ